MYRLHTYTAIPSTRIFGELLTVPDIVTIWRLGSQPVAVSDQNRLGETCETDCGMMTLD